jgi:tetratricopeptide (TPR) repeat protein
VHLEQAEVDADKAVALVSSLRPEMRRQVAPQAYLHRADVRVQRKCYAAAEQDLTRALELGMDIRALSERAKVRELRNDKAGARLDREACLAMKPADEASWNDRGLAQLPANPRAALADFEQALKLNPTFYPSLQNTVHVLSEHLGQQEKALEVMTRVVRLYPDIAQARISRGVLLARLGKRAEAHKEACKALAADRTPLIFYQAANIYSLTSRQEPRDAEHVCCLLAAALLRHFGQEIVDKDSDMDPVRDREDFRQLLRVTRDLEREVQNGP